MKKIVQTLLSPSGSLISEDAVCSVHNFDGQNLKALSSAWISTVVLENSWKLIGHGKKLFCTQKGLSETSSIFPRHCIPNTNALENDQNSPWKALEFFLWLPVWTPMTIIMLWYYQTLKNEFEMDWSMRIKFVCTAVYMV